LCIGGGQGGQVAAGERYSETNWYAYPQVMVGKVTGMA